MSEARAHFCSFVKSALAELFRRRMTHPLVPFTAATRFLLISLVLEPIHIFV
jgi:hypothetical protein